ncbi:hypothetical protein ACF1A5_24550 [Streptomyces sp. NPDC014864]|uniref:hypothetical protein n=1 Tax=Streptomyces sp. NPDC014864 TaxID=3364924 RepID=UPI0037034A9F
MIDHDLPTSGAGRTEALLCRPLGHACMALQAAPVNQTWPVFAYVSLPEGGLGDEVLTSNVTFCSDRSDLPRYVGDVVSYRREALLELSVDARLYC